jgi:uncharacterized protein YbjT (DUF2867 family)
LDQHDVEQPIEDCLLAGCRGRQFAREQVDGVLQRVAIVAVQMERGWECLDQLAAHIASELVSAAQKHVRLTIASHLVVAVLSPELVVCEAIGSRPVGEVVVLTAPHEGDVAGREPECLRRFVKPQPGIAVNYGVDCELDRARQAQSPRGSGDRTSEETSRCSCSGEVFLEHVHELRVSRSNLIVRHIDTRVSALHDGLMTSNLTLVLGGTGKTGARVATRHTELGVPVRTAARHDADVLFDWDDPATHRDAVEGADSVYLIAPVMRTRFAPQVSTFLDLAEAMGVHHVTFLSAYGVGSGPAEVALRTVELDLMARSSLTYSILRPAWFMQNFSETFLIPVDGAIVVPTGNGGEAFVDADDIAAVAAATLADPEAHAGGEYTPTGPDVLTVGDAADIIGRVVGRRVRHVDVDRRSWIDGVIASGVPPEYAEMLQILIETVASGCGSQPKGDIERVTGAPPRNFTDFANRTAAWRGDQAL